MPIILRCLQPDEGELDADWHRVLESCRREVERLAKRAVDSMGQAQLRGYLRAHATSLVRAELRRRALAGRSVAGDKHTAVTQRLERFVHAIVDDLSTARLIVLPAPHVTMRAA